jgi:type I restriction enzyme M protein
MADSRRLVPRLVAGSNVLRDSGVNMYEYTEQLTYLLFKMAEERATRPLNPERVVPDEFAWYQLLGLSGEVLEDTAREVVEDLTAALAEFEAVAAALETRATEAEPDPPRD